MEVNRLIILSFVLLFALTGCANRKLGNMEASLGTDGTHSAIFHRVAEGDSGLGLRFPGYIIGIEKSPRENLGLEACKWNDQEYVCNDIDDISRIDFKGNHLYKNDVTRNLGDRKRTFISHIIRYKAVENKNFKYIDEDFIFNAYAKKYYGASNMYNISLDQINVLKDILAADVARNNYSHIMVYSMGWNTDQQESLRNYNSLIGMIYRTANGRNFNPLFIGISWPSEWTWDVLDGVGKVLSYPVKSEDADEVGMVWLNRILRRVLVPLKTEKQLPLVIVGHSFGGRLTTRGIFGYNDDLVKNHKKEDIDLVVGLEAAFASDRFMTTKESHEGAPYADFKDYARKFVFTWSENDGANPIAFWTHFMGGKKVLKFTENKPYFKQYKINVAGNFIEPSSPLFDPHNSWDLQFAGVVDRNNPVGGSSWISGLQDPTTIAIVDASSLVKFSPYLKGGKAHSDIYTPAIGQFMWTMLDQIPKVVPENKESTNTPTVIDEDFRVRASLYNAVPTKR